MMSDKKVMIVEDQEDINNLIAYNLKKEGFYVEQVFEGLNARQRIKEEVFDIIILDIMLPGIDGYEICKAIKADPRHDLSFIIVISAKSQAEDKLYAQLLGANYYLTKPFNLIRLLAIIKEVRDIFNKELSVKIKNEEKIAIFKSGG